MSKCLILARSHLKFENQLAYQSKYSFGFVDCQIKKEVNVLQKFTWKILRLDWEKRNVQELQKKLQVYFYPNLTFAYSFRPKLTISFRMPGQ